MPIATFDPKKVAVIVGGKPISGFASDSFVKVTRTTNTWEKVTGVDGLTTRIRQGDKSGRIEITLMQSSPDNDYFSGLCDLDEATGGGVVPILIKDLLGTSLDHTPAAWIVKPVDTEFGKSSKDRVWAFECVDLDKKAGGNPAIF